MNTLTLSELRRLERARYQLVATLDAMRRKHAVLTPDFGSAQRQWLAVRGLVHTKQMAQAWREPEIFTAFVPVVLGVREVRVSKTFEATRYHWQRCYPTNHLEASTEWRADRRGRGESIPTVNTYKAAR